MILTPLQPSLRRLIRILIAFTPTRIFFIIQIFSNMRFYMNIAVLVLAALSPVLAAPRALTRYGDLHL
jgi:hypothetical protein